MAILQKISKSAKAFGQWRYRDYAIIGSLVVVIVLANLVWTLRETRPPHWDMARHLYTSINYVDMAKGANLKAWILSYWYYPPLVYWAAVPFYLLFGLSISSGILVNSLFAAILAFSIYGLGKELHSRRAGLLASFFVLTTPMIVTQFKEFQLDAPVAAMAALTLWLLAKSREFSNRRYTVWFGVALGLSALTKWTAPFILAAPIAGAVFLALAKSLKTKRWDWLGNLLFGSLIAYAIASLWYLSNLHQLKVDLALNSGPQGTLEGDPSIGTTASNLWYIIRLESFQLYLLPTILFLAALLASLRRKVTFARLYYPLLLIAGTYAFFTVLHNKDIRYTVALLTGVGLTVGMWVADLRPRLRQIISGLIVVYGVITFIAISFGLPWLPSQVDFKVGENQFVTFAQHGYIIGQPSGEQWWQEDLFKAVTADAAEPKTLLHKGADTIWFNNTGMTYYAQRYRVGLINDLTKATYVAVRDVSESTETPGTLIWQRTLPDKSILSLYRTIH